MDQKKIGKFIQERRKLKELTQVELADKLGVSNRTISSWENGNSLPDYSMFQDLCNELDISINELLSGEKLTEENYQQKLEENFVSTIDCASHKRTHTVRSHLNNVPRALRPIDTQGRVVACRAWGRGQELVFKGRGVSVLQDVKNSGDWR